MKLSSEALKERSLGLAQKFTRTVTVPIRAPIEFMDAYSKDATIHGVKYFSEKKRHWIEKQALSSYDVDCDSSFFNCRCFWMIIFTLSIALCTQNVLKVYEKRKTEPVMISIAQKLSPTYAIPFPAVTICPESKAARGKIDKTKVLLSRGNASWKEIAKLQALQQVCDLEDDVKFDQFVSKVNVIETLRQLAHPIDEIFRRCRYGTRNFFDCKKIFDEIVTDEGICYTFNMLDQNDLYRNETMNQFLRYPRHGKPSKWFNEKDYEFEELDVYPQRAIGSGVHSGLHMELRMRKSDISKCKRGINGFRLLLHTPAEVPQLSKHSYNIPFNKRTSIAVSPRAIYPSDKIRDYDPESRQCSFNNERHLKFFKIYAKSSCDLECLVEQILTACGCVKFSMPHEHETEVCDHTKLNCIYEAERNYTTQKLEWKLLKKKLKRDLDNGKITKNDLKLKELKKLKPCLCLPSCTSLRFDAEISQTDLIDEESQEYLTAGIDIYFKSRHFTSFRRNEMYGLAEFLSNTGGIFSLFLGCSVLSLIEIVYHLILYCIKKMQKQRGEVEISKNSDKQISSLADISGKCDIMKNLSRKMKSQA